MYLERTGTWTDTKEADDKGTQVCRWTFGQIKR